MTVMTRCCCCGIRDGSIACAIYSMVISVIGAAYFGYAASVVDVIKRTFGQSDIVNLFLSIYVIAVIVFIILIIACILLIVGICQDMKGLLIPYMVAQALHFFWYVYFFIVDAYFVALISGNAGAYLYIAFIVLLVPFLIVDIVCLLCVISQYQEYCDGRGCADNQPTTQTTVVIQQQATPIQPVQGPSVAYVANPPQQGPPPY